MECVEGGSRLAAFRLLHCEAHLKISLGAAKVTLQYQEVASEAKQNPWIRSEWVVHAVRTPLPL